ncbi:MAG: CpaF family protein [Anaerolineales bacterium]|nr:CpaF family protein [Anaerolineales bacterium]
MTTQNTPAASAGLLSLMTPTTRPVTLSREMRREIQDEVARMVSEKFSSDQLRRPTDAIREAAQALAGQATALAIRRRGLTSIPYVEEQKLAAEITRRLVGLGFLDLLLPPARRDIAEIALDAFGVVWLKLKGRREFTPALDLELDLVEVETIFSNVLGQQLKAASEANPSINAKLPRTKDNPGGGRIKYIHPILAPGAGFPSVNIRLFEPEPVRPEKLLDWGMLDEPTLDLIAGLVRAGRRGFICGGTSSGKTTMLSMLCNFLPVDWRILTIEDPQEIWIDNPHVVTLEARPASAASELRPYLLRDGVDDAMRMTPDYLVVGEVRDGLAGQGLFRAMMSDHAGMSTFHAENPALAVERMALLLEADTRTSAAAARKMFVSALDWLMQIGFDADGRRRVFQVVEVAEDLTQGEVTFNPLVTYRGDGRWERVGDPSRKRGGHTAKTSQPAGWRDILALDDGLREQFRPVIERRRAAFRA